MVSNRNGTPDQNDFRVQMVNLASTSHRRKTGTKPPVLLVLLWPSATIALWLLINTYAGRPVWWW
ncbi:MULTISPECIES: hypothetical protein [unclassified Methylobacterium]|uniref:hypothetical protein n=1 Tax=unclassified Methylobacterium TaxID=2615210 RepID=UPI002269914D|nr:MULTISPECIES: hypothetical protein [unclassified Methylobacterium]